jgi:ABC-type Fe3+-siderophore transport system permease subunit
MSVLRRIARAPLPLVLAGLLLLLVLSSALSAMVYGAVDGSSVSLSIAGPGDLWSWLVGDELEARIFWRLRLPRIAGAGLVGAGLAMGGFDFMGRVCFRV